LKTRIVKAHILAALLVGAASFAAPHGAEAAPPPAKGGAAAPAPAAPKAGGDKPSSPRELYKSGEAKLKSGDYAGALIDFQAVDAIKATPQSAHKIGVCQDKLAHYQEAISAYERFLAAVPDKMKKEGDDITKRVAEIKAMPGKVHVETTPGGALVSIDGKSAQPSPVDADLPPGKHTLHVTADGREPQDRDLDVTYASKTDVNLQLVEKAGSPPTPIAALPPPPAAAPAATAPPPPPPEPRSKLPAYITGGLAVVAAGVGTVFGVMALGDKSDFDKTPTSQKADDGENHALIADMAFGVAVTLGVTSAVLFLTNDEPAKTGLVENRVVAKAPKKSSPFTITPSPIVTPHGGGAGALIRF
jgi:hypothetical protein